MNDRKEKALQALLVSPTRKAAAKAAGIDPETLRRYLKDPEFLQAYSEAQGRSISVLEARPVRTI